MTCTEVQDLIEPIAAGDLQVTAGIRAHLETCPSCAAALATARRIETMLASRPVLEPSPAFASVVQQRIRGDRWALEQRVDRIFNLAIAAAVVLFAAGIIFLVRGSVVIDATAQVLALLTTAGGSAVQVAAPSITTYIAATGLVISGLAMWWWAES